MALLSTYTADSSIDGTEFLIGSESDGTTKRFLLSDLQTYLSTVTAVSTTFSGSIVPNADDSLDIGASGTQWKDLYIDGIAYIDQLGTDADPTASAFISGGEIDGVQIGGESPSSAVFTDVNITGTFSFDGAAGSSGQFLIGNGTSATPTFQTAGLNNLSDVLIADDSLYIGQDPSSTDSTAQYNIGIGATALDAITTGDKNVVIGYDAGTSIQGTSDTVIIGFEAGKTISSATAGGSIFIGSEAGKSVTSGTGNIAIGRGALDTNTAGDNNIAIGTNALSSLDTGGGDDPDGNIAIGFGAALNMTTGDGATFLGYQVGQAVTTGDHNTFIGYQVGQATTTGHSNVALGYQALYTNIDGDGGVAIGFEALYTSEPSDGLSNNVAVGYRAGKATTTGTGNTLIGSNAGTAVTTGASNVAVGADALKTNNIGTKNVAVGEGALQDNVDGSKSVAVGTNALTSQEPSGATDMHNVAIGEEAGTSISTGTTNTVVGSLAGDALTTGSGNTALGYNVAFSAVGASNQTVIGNGAVGHADNVAVIGNTSITAIHPGQTSTVDLGSSSYVFKDIYMDSFLFGNRIPTDLVTANDTLTAAESGKTFVFNDADGAILTLPDSGAGDIIGVYYNFAIAVTATSNAHKVVCSDTTNEKLFGEVLTIDTDSSDANASFAAQAGDSFSAITCNGGTTGIIGSTFRVQNIAADKWIVSGNIHCTGSPGTPFAAS